MAENVGKDDIVREKARRLTKAREAAGFAKRPELFARYSTWSKDTYASHELGRRDFDETTARKYSAAFGVPVSFLMARDITDADVEPSNVFVFKPKPNASFPPKYQAFSRDASIPLLGRAAAGPNGRFVLNGTEIGRVFCPPGLEGVRGAYAVQVVGTSGEPRFREGETVWVDPHAPVMAKDDVVAQILTDGEDFPVESYIKQYRSKTADILRLWQYNPGEGESNELNFRMKDVFAIHKVVFHSTI